MPRVSVLIPTYNRAGYLPEAIWSALHQTLREIQVIVVDDGSTDNTAEVVATHRDPRLRYIYQENGGVSAALNTAWRAASGEYVAMLGSDDVMLPHQLATLLPIIESDPSLGLVYARAQAMTEKGEPLPQILGASLKFPSNPLASVLYANSICSISAIIRRQAIEEVDGFNDALIANEDWDLWIRLAERWDIHFVEQVLARYRIHANSLTASKSAQYETIADGRIQIITNYYEGTSIPQAARDVQSVALRNVYMDAAIRALTVGKHRAAFSYFTKALATKNNPIATTLRFLFVTVFDFYLSKTPWGVRLTDALLARRHAVT